MKKEDIKINGLYAMKVGKNTIGVRIWRQNTDGHWVGVNVNTKKEVIIKSPTSSAECIMPNAARPLNQVKTQPSRKNAPQPNLVA